MRCAIVSLGTLGLGARGAGMQRQQPEGLELCTLIPTPLAWACGGAA